MGICLCTHWEHELSVSRVNLVVCFSPSCRDTPSPGRLVPAVRPRTCGKFVSGLPAVRRGGWCKPRNCHMCCWEGWANGRSGRYCLPGWASYVPGRHCRVGAVVWFHWAMRRAVYALQVQTGINVFGAWTEVLFASSDWECELAKWAVRWWCTGAAVPAVDGAPGFWSPVEILAVMQCNLGQVALRTWYWHARDDWESWVGSAVSCICLPNSGVYKGAVLSYG